MPKNKPRRTSSSYYARGKGGKGRYAARTRSQQPSTVPGQVHDPVSPAGSKIPSPVRDISFSRYHLVGNELRRIGVFAGIVLVILVILFFVLT